MAVDTKQENIFILHLPSGHVDSVFPTDGENPSASCKLHFPSEPFAFNHVVAVILKVCNHSLKLVDLMSQLAKSGSRGLIFCLKTTEQSNIFQD